MRFPRIRHLGAVLWTLSVSGSGSAAEDFNERLDRIAENSRLHYELTIRHYDRALEEMANLNDIDMVEDVTGTTALSLACQDDTADAYDVVKPLLTKFGSDHRIVDNNGLTALHYAAHSGTYSVVELLLEMGADVNASQDEDGVITPLYMAYQQGNTRIVEMLRAFGAKELDDELRSHLDIVGALNKSSRIPLPNDTPIDEVMRIRFNSMASTLEENLNKSGRIKDLEAWLQVRPKVMEVVRNTPIDPDISAQEYQQLLIQKVFQAIGEEANQ